MGSESDSIISKDFMERLLGRKVVSLTTKSHADTGDNFMSVLYSFDVTTEKNDTGNDPRSQIDTLYLFCKCYPSNPGRQDYLMDQNLFWKELLVYKQWIPELFKFQEELGITEIIKPNFPTFVAGDAVNFHQYENGKIVKSTKSLFLKDGILFSIRNNYMHHFLQGGSESQRRKVYHPFDNYIMMVDLCKTDGFKLGDRTVGLNKDHILVATEALAKLHALSWAYIRHNKIDNIRNNFPTFEFDCSSEYTKQFIDSVVLSAVDETIHSLASSETVSSELLSAVSTFRDKAPIVLKMGLDYHHGDETEVDFVKFFRLKPPQLLHTEVPWRVVIQGDSHMANMLFRYNSETQKPEEVILIDQQMCRESCPIVDLVDLVYTSTDTQFRENHLEEMLELYYEKFNYFCNLLKTESLPGFSIQEVKRRFHRLKIFGFALSLVITAIFLKEKEDSVQLDSLLGMDQGEIISSLLVGMSRNKKYNERIEALVKEVYVQGVI